MQHPPFVRPAIVQRLNLEEAPVGAVTRFRVVLTENASGNETLVPAIVMRAAEPGPVVGVTAAVHGNELNGVTVIQRLVQTLQPVGLKKGTLVAIPIVNVPGYLRHQREFEDGVDLNRIMPGKPQGTESQLYAHRLLERIFYCFDYLLDLHTASFGRANSLYVRADMSHPVTAQMARLVCPQIIVHSSGGDGTVRATATERGIHSITIEVGDPSRLQRGLVRSARLGVQEVLEHLGMIDNLDDPDPGEIIECGRSYWTFTDRGGVLSVLPSVVDRVRKGDVVATLHNVWGDLVREYRAPEDGVIVGKATNPAARAGSRIIHLGVTGALDAS